MASASASAAAVVVPGGIRADDMGINAPSGNDGCQGVVTDQLDYP